MFLTMSDTTNVTWSPEQKQAWKLYGNGTPKRFVVPFTLRGTMVSGDPFTTLTNTFRTILYHTYIHQGHDVDVAAAGDDGVGFPTASDADAAIQRILAQTSRTNDVPSPLGQIVKQAKLSSITEIDFCSKWFYMEGGVLYATRDLTKLLATRHYYTRRNAHLLCNPALYRYAIL